MKVDKELILHVAEVARLKLTETEVKKFVSEFKEILDAFSILDEINVEKTKMSIQPVDVKNVLREDKAEECFSQEKALAQAKTHKKDGYFKGPKAV
ncbi:Asp-tRNA(Asn)/Glu-tRNA(Gln) amidotransferase subunit GatC [Candidatus Woesearchaeota archaeon]|nr:Asp-tRNA(Asn)/Glu-tRNA(Gln) amidotransferase subunit GatC [Candidatus Woesearchaeota archaeon]